MKSMIVTLVLITMLVNISAGVVITTVVDSDGNKIFDNTAQSGYTFGGENYSDLFTSEMEKTIQPSGTLDDKGDQVYQILQMMQLGFVYNFLSVVDNYMYGLVNMLDNIVGQYMTDESRSLIFGNDDDNDLIPNKFGMFKLVITLSYILTGISLLTGKNVTEV